MQINLKRKNDAVHFEASNEDGALLQIDGSPEIGGQNLGFRPMQMLLAGLGGCSGIDIISILKKQRQTVTGFDIQIDGQREAGKEPSLFENIKVHFVLEGEIDPDKAQKAVQLSMDKYCSVAKTLEKTATITYTWEVNGTEYKV